MNLEETYNLAIDMGVEKCARQDEMLPYCLEYQNEDEMYKLDILEIANEIKDKVTEMQLYKFVQIFDKDLINF